ncbi:LLM class flavin-dependent oxidoreductase [Nocardia sputorum]|uniref:LLM class flavin-dependent oxidoreductase n=1 Tax=Nocardia sputorum TaxID=2984338 RepID=UPI00331345D9
MLDEQLEAIRKIWTEDLAEIYGRFLDFDPMYAWPKPVQRPHPPIFLGGGQAAAERAIRHGVGRLPAAVSDPAAIPAQLSALHGNDLPVTVAFVATDRALIDGYAESGAQRLLFSLPTLPESETLRALDDIAKPAGHHLG